MSIKFEFLEGRHRADYVGMRGDFDWHPLGRKQPALARPTSDSYQVPGFDPYVLSSCRERERSNVIYCRATKIDASGKIRLSNETVQRRLINQETR